MKKIISIILLVSMMLLTACNDPAPGDMAQENEPTGGNEATESSEIAESEEPEELVVYTELLPEADYDDYEFNIFGELSRDEYEAFDGLNGDAVNDALYERNRKVEEKYSVKLNYTLIKGQTGAREITNLIASQDDTYDFVSAVSTFLGNLVLKRSFYDWAEIDNINLDRPYYVQDALKCYSIGDYSPMLFGDYNESNITCCWVYTFNKRLVDHYLDGVDIYEVVQNGDWTADYFRSLVQDLRVDLDGNGEYDETDFYGFATDKYGAADSYVRSFGLSALKKNEQNLPELDFYKETTVDAYQDLYKLYYETLGVYAQGGAYAHITTMFVPGKVVFSNMFLMHIISSLREMEDDYGVVPYPKYFEYIDKYPTYLNSGFSSQLILTCQPAEDTARTGMITEALNAYSYELLTPALYEKTLKGKVSRDAATSKMLDLVLEGREYSFDAFAEMEFKLNPAQVLRTNILAGVEDISSYYQSVLPSCQAWVDKVIATINENSETPNE